MDGMEFNGTGWDYMIVDETSSSPQRLSFYKLGYFSACRGFSHGMTQVVTRA